MVWPSKWVEDALWPCLMSVAIRSNFQRSLITDKLVVCTF